ncbi:FxsA family protein [Methylotenera mobilis]|uniref:FxsA cytoplasmic membrane protein n=1 Tax=Methylotenera mobilis (strain JLW8 / ATCC BAA-1282 / DSM 17540) TaxID=583345 RepID=C6WYU6_METML|nr:FxsA family protein [Methylotenera mobilis]ACT47071.1 FxsA cytoplasmic membrane protein [Methylotenera mobilis JLW8]
MRLLIGLILLAFPVAEIWLLIELGQQYGWWLLVYLVGIAVLGVRLIQEEKSKFSGRMMQTLSAGNHPMKAMFGSARNIIAGVLLIIPGVITDIIAVILLLVPIKNSQTPNAQSPYQAGHAANDDVIEGEFRRED